MKYCLNVASGSLHGRDSLGKFRKGFMLGDRLLRPAMVKVSYSEAPAAPAAAM
jgi:hypothetical protein